MDSLVPAGIAAMTCMTIIDTINACHASASLRFLLAP
jgi:hypothetical protein